MSTKNTAETRLLLACIKANVKNTSTEVKSFLNSKDSRKKLNWKSFLRIIPFHMSGLVYEVLKEFNQIPSKVRVELKKNVSKQTMKKLALLSMFKEINCLFDKQNIKFVLLKGFLTDDKVYLSKNRFFEDLDVLIKKKDLVVARETLIKNNFFESNDTLNKFKCPKTFDDYKPHKTFFKKIANQFIKLELHTSLLETFSPFYLHEKNLFENTSPYKLDKLNVSSLNEEFFLIHICTHFVYTHAYANPIASAYEIGALIDSDALDLDKLIILCKKTKTSEMVYAAIDFSRKLFDVNRETNIVSDLLEQLKSQSNQTRLNLLSFFAPVNLKKSNSFFRTRLLKWIIKFFFADSFKHKKQVFRCMYYSFIYRYFIKRQ